MQVVSFFNSKNTDYFSPKKKVAMLDSSSYDTYQRVKLPFFYFIRLYVWLISFTLIMSPQLKVTKTLRSYAFQVQWEATQNRICIKHLIASTVNN